MNVIWDLAAAARIGAVRTAAAPVRIGFELTPSQYARYEALLAKMGLRGDPADLLLAMMESFRATKDVAPRGATGPHDQIHVHECPACNKTTVQAPRGKQDLSADAAETARCDAEVHHPGQRRKTTTPPRSAANLVTLCPACHELWPRQGGHLNTMLTTVPAAPA